MADKEDEGRKDTFIFSEVLIFFQIEIFCYLLFW